MRNWPIFVIPSAARDLVFSATYEEKISRFRLEMTIATQSQMPGGGEGGGESNGRFRLLIAGGQV
jgi:hypothetical protein